jgi:hypothetical protein
MLLVELINLGSVPRVKFWWYLVGRKRTMGTLDFHQLVP